MKNEIIDITTGKKMIFNKEEVRWLKAIVMRHCQLIDNNFFSNEKVTEIESKIMLKLCFIANHYYILEVKEK